MSKHIRRALRIIPAAQLVSAALMLIISFFIRDIPVKVSHFYKNGRIVTDSWHETFTTIVAALMFIIIILTAVYIIICISAKVKHKEDISGKIPLAVLIAAVCAVMLFFSDIMVCGLWGNDDYEPEYYEFSNGQHTIVIEEKSFLLHGGGTVYQIMDNDEAVAIHQFTTDDGGRNKGNYDIKWYGDHAELTYSTFSSGDSKRTEKIRFVAE